MGPLEQATAAAVAGAEHLTKADEGAIEALRSLARKIDQEDWRWSLLAEDAEEHKGRPPSQDNVSVPTYLKYCEALGLTPSGRAKLKPSQDKPVGKLAALRSVAAG